MSGAAGTAMARSALWGVAATAVERLSALAVALWLPRHLGLEDYGRYTLVVAFLGLFQMLPDAGLDAVLVARMAGEAGAPRTRAAIAGRGAFVRLLVSTVGAAAGLAALAAVSREPALVAAAAWWSAGLLVTAGNPYRPLLRAELRLGRYFAVAAVQALVSVAALGAVVAVGGGLGPVLACGAAGALAAVALGRALAGERAPLARDRTLAAALMRAAWPLAATTLVLVGAQQALAALLLHTHGPAAVGLLGGAQRLVDAVNLLPQAVAVTLLPALARAAAAAPATARDAARALGAIVSPLVVGLVLWPEPVLGTVFGAGFIEAAPVLRVLAPAALLAASGSVLTALLVTAGRQRLLLAVTMASAVATLLLGLVLVPSRGVLGVAAAAVCGMAVGQGVLAAGGAAAAAARAVLAGIVRPLTVAAVAAGLAIALVGRPGAAPVAALAYVAGVAVTGIVRARDLRRWAR